MANFAEDTAVERVGAAVQSRAGSTAGGVRYRAQLAPAWEVWGPIGGYVAAIALRALAAETDLPRPASFHCNFLSVARFAPVAREGIIGCRGHLWSGAGRLLASGNATLFCRPNPMAAEPAAATPRADGASD